MKRPEKKELGTEFKWDFKGLRQQFNDTGYNQACEDWEEFLPTDEKIKKTICYWKDIKGDSRNCGDTCTMGHEYDCNELTKAISKLIGGEK